MQRSRGSTSGNNAAPRGWVKRKSSRTCARRAGMSTQAPACRCAGGARRMRGRRAADARLVRHARAGFALRTRGLLRGSQLAAAPARRRARAWRGGERAAGRPHAGLRAPAYATRAARDAGATRAARSDARLCSLPATSRAGGRSGDARGQAPARLFELNGREQLEHDLADLAIAVRVGLEGLVEELGEQVGCRHIAEVLRRAAGRRRW